MKKTVKSRGITLITLVITIIVLLILAGVSVSLIAGENGILKRATNAVDKHRMETSKEAVELVVADFGAEYFEERYDKQNQNLSDVDDYIQVQFGSNRETTDGSKATIKKKKVEVSQNEKLLATGALEEGRIIWDAEPKEKPKPMEPTEVYVKLYEDGTLIFSSFNYTDETKTVKEDYGEVSSLDCASWYEENPNVTNVIIYDKIAPKNTRRWFYECRNLTKLDVSNLDTSNVTNVEQMFYKCRNLTQLDVSNLDTGNVTDMGDMFYECGNLTQLDVSNFDTGNVTDMGGMFYGCRNLIQLDVSNFDTSNVTSLQGMFNSCEKITTLDLRGFETQNVTGNGVQTMFWGCENLKELKLNVDKFDTGKVTSMYCMFAYCYELTNLDVSKFNTSNVTNLQGMFLKCSKLENLHVSNFNTSNVKDMYIMFSGCSSLKEIDISNFDVSKVKTWGYMFANTSSDLTVYINSAIQSKMGASLEGINLIVKEP